MLFICCFTLPAKAERLTLFHTADVKGLASNYTYQLQLPYVLLADFVHNEGQRLGVKDFGITKTSVLFYSQGVFLWGPQMGIQELREFLKSPPEALHTQNISSLNSFHDVVLEVSDNQRIMSELQRFIAEQEKYTKQLRRRAFQLIEYPEKVFALKLSPQAQLQTEALNWELVLGFHVRIGFADNTENNLLMIAKPNGEGTRRMRLIEKLRGPSDLLVDSGNLLEGLSSVLTNQLSLQRKNSLKMAQELNYTAMNVGKSELQGGLTNLLDEQEQYGLPYISASLLKEDKYIFPPFKRIKLGRRDIAMIGLADVSQIQRMQELGDLSTEIQVLDTQQALDRALQELEQQGGADIVLLLSSLERAELQNLVEFNRNIHMILANTDATLQHLRESVTLSQFDNPRPFLANANPNAVQLVEIKTNKGELQLRNEMVPIYFELLPNTDYLAQIMQIRQDVYVDALDTLIPDLGPIIREDPELVQIFLDSDETKRASKLLSGLLPLERERLLEIYPTYMTRELLANLEMNALMEAFNAELVVFKISRSMELNVPGAVPKFLVYERLKMRDTLGIYYLNGVQLGKLLNLKLDGLIFGGVSPDKLKVWGRPLGNIHNVYKVLIPSGVASLKPVQEIMQGVRIDEKLDLPFDREHRPEKLYLRNTLVQFFEHLSQQDNQVEEMKRLMKPRWLEKRGLFRFELNNFQLNLSGYNAMNNDAYAEVRETRVISPSSFTFGGRTDFAVNWDNLQFGFRNGLNAKYEGLSVLEEAVDDTAQERFTENQDDLVFSSELQMRLFEFDLLSNLPLTPFLEGIYDTEFTPTLNKETQLLNPRQSELRGVFGLSIPAGPQLKTFKSGLAVRRDFNVPNNFETGFDIKMIHELPVTSRIRWQNDLDFRYFFPTPNDNASSLGLIAQWVSAVKFSLTDNLALRLFADSYLFQGKLPETSDFGASVILGVGLSYERLWKPAYEPLF